MCRLALFFGIAACLGFSATEGVHISQLRGRTPAGVCAGCVFPIDPKDPELMKELKASLAEEGANLKPKRITEAWSQIVAGEKYIVDFVTEDKKKCHASWVSAPWISKKPIYVSYSCSNHPKAWRI